MHRFGRSAQKQMNDRWGGVFILAVVLAVVGAWQLGGYLGNLLGDENKQAAMEPVPGMETVNQPQGLPTGTQTPMAQQFQVHFVQVGAFRSEGAARNLVKDLAELNMTAAVTERNIQGLVKVYVGPFMTGEAADEAKSLLAEVAPNAFNVTMDVDYKPDAVMAMSGAANPDLQTGLDTLNSYLYEAGAWFAKRSAGEPADGAALSGLGQEMVAIAQNLAKAEVGTAVGKFIAMADVATTNAADIEVAANANPGSEEFQKAMSGYVSLLERYHTFYMESGSEQ